MLPMIRDASQYMSVLYFVRHMRTNYLVQQIHWHTVLSFTINEIIYPQE